MLNMHTGPLTLLAETQATVRIREDFLDDEELDSFYPKARTLSNPRGDAPQVHIVRASDLKTMESTEATLAAAARTGLSPEEVKELAATPAMEDELPDAEFSVFVRVDTTTQHTRPEDEGERSSESPDIDSDILRKVEDARAHETWASRRSDLFSMSARSEQILELAATPGVTYVDAGETVRKLPVATAETAEAPMVSERRVRNSDRHGHGKDVIIGVIDVEGFDFAHEDFIDELTGETRFLAIWDQGATEEAGFRPPPRNTRHSDFRMGYGAEIRKDHMDAAIRGAAAFGLLPTDVEPQSAMIPGSHGTHVASIAAGNLGIARKADIVGVSIALADGDMDKRRSFYDSSRLAHAVDYILDFADNRAQELGRPVPVSINISLGTNGHSHDGTAAISRWIDFAVATPGRAVTVAAGNAGRTDPSHVGGIGHLLGRIHAEGRIEARELSQELGWEVFGDGLADISMNEMEIWYPAQDRISVQLIAPDGQTFPIVTAGHQLLNEEGPDQCRVSIFNDRYHPVNGFNRISIYLEPFLAANNVGLTAVVGIPAGRWTVKLIGDEIRDGSWHAWIERDDPAIIGDFGGVTAAQFPSAFSTGTFSPRMQVSTLACGAFVNSVANLDPTAGEINPSSSRGPTRTGDAKPDIAASGTAVVAASGFSQTPWTSMSGTSMAAPHVAGVVGLMLAIDPGLTATQITSILRRTARPLPGRTFRWQDDAGFGEIDAERAIQETLEFSPTRHLEAAAERLQRSTQ